MNKLSYISITNKCNVSKARIFHIYRNGKNCKSKVSFFLKASVKKLKPLKKIEFKKKKKIFTILIRSKQWILRFDGSQRKFSDNSALILKKNLTSWNDYLRGPTVIELKRQKILAYFKEIF